MFESNFNTFKIFHVLLSQYLLKILDIISIPDQEYSLLIQQTPMIFWTLPATRGSLLVYLIPSNNLMAQTLEIVSKYWLKSASNSESKPQNGIFFSSHITILVQIKLNISSYHLLSARFPTSFIILIIILRSNYYDYYPILQMRKLKLGLSSFKKISKLIHGWLVFELRYLWLQN